MKGEKISFQKQKYPEQLYRVIFDEFLGEFYDPEFYEKNKEEHENNFKIIKEAAERYYNKIMREITKFIVENLANLLTANALCAKHFFLLSCSLRTFAVQ